MGKIVAIGGGEIGGSGYQVETTKIDSEIIRLSGKRKPKLLFIPTASSDAEGYVETVENHFGKSLRCVVDVLYLIKDKPSGQEIEKKILGSDIVYVGGGDTGKMLRAWKRTGTDKILRKAHERGIVLSGLSAGAICWFRYGSSDTKRFLDRKAGLTSVRGLGLINATFCPHYGSEMGRKAHVKEMMKTTPGVAMALDNCCAIEIVNGMFRILSSKRGANAYNVYWKRGKFHHELIPKGKGFAPLGNLLNP